MKKPTISVQPLWAALLFYLLLSPQNTRADTIFVNTPLDEIVINAQRSDLGNSAYQLITTITRVDIENMPVRSLDDILRFIPGIDLRSRGIDGGQTDISMRGGTFDQVMILLNGVSVNDLQTGHYSMNLPVDIALIERIEVLQGGGSDLFGGNALSGAINIITRTDTHADQYKGRIAAGMYGYVMPAFAGRNIGSDFDIAYSANFSRADGYKAPDISGKEATALRNSDYLMANLWFQSSFYGVDLQLGAQYKDIGAGMFYGYGSQDQFDATRTAFSSARYTGRWNGWSLEALLSYRANYDHYEWHRGESQYSNTHLNQDAAASVKSSYSYHIGKTSAGIELRNHNIRSTNLGDNNRLDLSWFASQMFSFRDFTADLSLNGIWDASFSHTLGGGVNLGYEFLPASSLYLNVGRTYRMPTFTDLYYDAGNQLGNPDLTSEKAWTFALGTTLARAFAAAGSLSADLSAYYRLGEDIIDWIYVADDTRRPFHAANLPVVHTAGLELSVGYRWNDWLKFVGLSYAYTFMDLGAYADCSRYLDHLSHKAVFRLEHALARLTESEFAASWALTYRQREGNFNDIDGTVRAYGDVLLLDGDIYWRNRFMKVAAACHNITNRRYYDYGGVLRPGAWFTAEVSVFF